MLEFSCSKLKLYAVLGDTLVTLHGAVPQITIFEKCGTAATHHHLGFTMKTTKSAQPFGSHFADITPPYFYGISQIKMLKTHV